jgi:glycopeptide antibiotics resistance protein
VGIFDIDDCILNALGVVIGYWAFTILANWIRSRNYKRMIVAAVTAVAALVVLYGGVVYPTTHPAVESCR